MPFQETPASNTALPIESIPAFTTICVWKLVNEMGNRHISYLSMLIDHPENWFLRKYDDGEIFGPISFDQILAWARAARINPQDMLSTDQEVWTKAPMIPELEMDWLIEISDVLLYGPTTPSALMEFVRSGEITPHTRIINSCTSEKMTLSAAPFFSEEALEPPAAHLMDLQPKRGGLKLNLQKRILELESALIAKRAELNKAHETISKLEAKIQALEKRSTSFRLK